MYAHIILASASTASSKFFKQLNLNCPHCRRGSWLQAPHSYHMRGRPAKLQTKRANWETEALAEGSNINEHIMSRIIMGVSQNAVSSPGGGRVGYALRACFGVCFGGPFRGILPRCVSGVCFAEVEPTIPDPYWLWHRGTVPYTSNEEDIACAAISLGNPSAASLSTLDFGWRIHK